ncbi:MAG: hypothetical protein Q7V01_03110 [Vicinamibacterales bacterium]|nr:hypothetical protein [Vicinamibacterales bacterium]
MAEKGSTVQISEGVIILIVLVALGAYLLVTFFESWGPSLRKLT